MQEDSPQPNPPLRRVLASPWPLTLGLFVPLWLLVQSRVWLGLELGVVDRGVLELWVHGPQPGWLDWVPFIHPPGYSLFMNTMDAVSRAAGVEAASLVFWFGAVLTLTASLLAVRVAQQRWGALPAVVVSALVVFDPQSLRPFEHYPLARLALLCAFLALTASPRVSLAAAIAATFVSVEIHLSSWFLLGPLLAWKVVFGDGDERGWSGRVLLSLLGLFALTTPFGLYEALAFGGGPGGDPGRATVEWANPFLLLALLLALRGRLRGPALAALCFTGITWALQTLQLADGTPFPYSLHYFELVGPVMVLILVGAWVEVRAATVNPKSTVTLLAVLLVASQWTLFLRGLLEIFVQGRWILMVG